MKKNICFLSVCSLLMALVFVSVSCFAAAAAENAAWDCPNCGRTGNTGKFCGECGFRDPSMPEDAGDSAREEKLALFRTPGNIVTFGHYEQDNDPENGPEEIEWIVLEYDEQENKALLISKYGLDSKPYHKKYTDITWENCSLREWLNGEFLEKAFTAEEQSTILLTDVDNSVSQGRWKVSGGNNTQDLIFVLSYAEANGYFGAVYGEENNSKLRAAPTAYAIAQGAWLDSRGSQTADGEAAGWWCLRSPGLYPCSVILVYPNDTFDYGSVDNANNGDRPALWISLDLIGDSSD